MSKVINIDENLFRVNSRSGSRKKHQTTQNTAGIKIKSQVRDQPKSLKRNHILRFIREQQEKNYKKLLEGDPYIRQDKDAYKEDFGSSFDNTLQYLMNIVETESPPPSSTSGQTIKNRHAREHVSMEIPATFQDMSSSFTPDNQNNPMQLSAPVKENAPKWGCLKSGGLPTYRNWKNHTQKVSLPNVPVTQNTQVESMIDDTPAFRELQRKRMGQIIQEEIDANIPALHYPKQKRIVRRTYKVGKSKIKPQIGVLISNRTIRSRVTTECQLLKQTPIEDVRRYLVKKGFIKVGSSCPNDVLRKMHETAKLMCGEVENHNPDNLLYNYFNSSE